jgi:hypothetical protein
MKQRTSQVLYAYWNDVRGDRMAPRRFEIEPSRIAAILPETFILERLTAETFRFRLAGTRICEQLGIELRGTDFLDLWTGEDRDLVQRDLATLARQGGAGLLEAEALTASGQGVRLELLLLPLVHTQNSVDRLLGALSPIDAPAWLGTERATRYRLLRHEVIWPDGRPHSLIERNHQAPFHATIQTARLVRSDRRQFRVYDGGRSETGNKLR